MEKGIAEFIAQATAEHDAILIDATTRVSNALVRESLVDTGEMVADWDVAIGDWPANVPHSPDPKKRVTRARLKEVISKAKIGDVIFFENNDPAAIQQELGHLKRQPNGLARLVARKWYSMVNGAGIAARNRVNKRLVID